MYPPSKWHVNGAKAFCGVMWFWIFYRFYHDYEGFVVCYCLTVQTGYKSSCTWLALLLANNVLHKLQP